MALKDNDQKKWEYSQHAYVKHLLLQKYLKAWIPILSKYNSKIAYFDGFSGRGQYEDGNYGSPILAMQACEEISHFKDMNGTKYKCAFIEKDPDNFENLVKVVDYNKGNFNSVDSVYYYNSDFETAINQILDNVNDKLIPSFFFIDPFGYSGVSFKTIKRIMSIPRTEIFFNFMTRDVGRFLSIDNQEKHFNNLFGNESWKSLKSLKGAEKEHALRDLYIANLYNEGCAKYVWPFRVCMDTRSQTLYYLIYATNHFLGLKIMKEIMHKQNDQFAYLGPDEFSYQAEKAQLRLFDPSISKLKDFLLARYRKGISKSFNTIIEETYMLTPNVESEYRAALKELRKDGKIRTEPITSKSERGLGGQDIVHF